MSSTPRDQYLAVCAELQQCKKDLAAARAERDAAFKMSRCECSADECCANLVKLHNDLAAAHKATLHLASVLDDLLAVMTMSTRPTDSEWRTIGNAAQRLRAAIAGQRRE